VREGLSAATGDYVVLMDADCSFHPNQIPRLLMALQNCDLVIGSRRHVETICSGKPPRHREVLGLTYNRLVRLLFGISVLDTQSGLKAMTRTTKDLAQDVDTDGFAFDTDLVLQACRKGLIVCETPIEYVHVEGSKLRAGHVLDMLRSILRIWLEIHKRRMKISNDETSIRKFYDSQKETYFRASHSYFLPRRWWRNSKDRSITHDLKLDSSSVLLDVGCGNGVMINRISKSFKLGCGIDLSGPAVEFANKQRKLLGLENVGFVRGDCRALPFRSGYFGRIVCSEVIEHVKAPGSAIAEFSRVISPEGVLIMTTPANNLRWALVEFVWTRVRRAIQEVNHHAISESRLATILKCNGFNNVTTKPILFGCLTLAEANM
jgi:ubiquinone/menaquinone biosynthesis C-methylase UbiE